MSSRFPVRTLLIRFAVCLAWVAALVFGGRASGVNSTTAALAFLLVVLGVATRWGLAEASFASVAAVVAFNYFFLPPVGTLTIADPQNWIALFAFFVTAITASQLSARARREMEETRSSRNELSRLYELSRSLLMNESGEPVRQAVVSVSQTLGGRDAAFFDGRSGRTWAVTGGAPAPETELLKVAQTGESVMSGEYTVVPVRLGARLVGSLAVQAEGLSAAACDSVANLVAINYERALALERAATAEIARRNEEFKSSLLNGLAHDLKTPLTAIRTCITRLVDFPPRSEELRHELLSIIDQESARLQRSISETIELARIESSDISLDRRRIAVSEILEAAIAESGDEDPGRFIVSGSSEAVLDGDPDLLRRALIQILENARKYSPPDSPIEIAVAESSDGDSGNVREIVISVSDNGPGFAPGELSRVFDKFYRGTAGRGREGTGMGLAIAKGIVEAHGGSITAANRAAANRAGGGAVLSFSVPRARDIHEHAHHIGSG